MGACVPRGALSGPILRRLRGWTLSVPRRSEVRGYRQLAAVPVLHRAVLRLDEPEEAPARAVAQRMAAHLDALARLERIARHADALQTGPAGRLERPCLQLTLGALHLDVDPGVRIDQVHFRHRSLEIGERVDVVAVR